MRLIMMGTGEFAVPTFRALVEARHDVPLVVTRPPFARGGRKPPPNPMVLAAGEAGIRVFDPPDVNDASSRERLRALQCDLLVVCDYGQILSAETLGTARLGGINLHASLLPKYRGAAPINWAILRGETETGVSVIQMLPRLDAGPCLAQVRTAIDPDDTAITLEARLALIGAEQVVRTVEDLARGVVRPVPQDEALASRAPRLRKEHGAVDWSRPAQAIRDQVRALQPWPTTYTYWHRTAKPPLRLILEEVAVVPAESTDPPGAIVRADPQQFCVATGRQQLALLRFRAAGGRLMTGGEFLRGHPVRVGERMGPEAAAGPRD